MTRDRLQAAYELAFFPPRVHELWQKLPELRDDEREETRDLVELALELHERLPERGFASPRALRRVARYQADARAFGLPACLRRIRQALGSPADAPVRPLDGSLVRDIGLPPMAMTGKRNPR